MKGVRPEESRVSPPQDTALPPASSSLRPELHLGQASDEVPAHTPSLPAELLNKNLSFGRSADGGPRYLKLEKDGSVSLTSSRADKSSRADLAKAFKEMVKRGDLSVTALSNLYRNADTLLQKRSVIQKVLDALGLSSRLSNFTSLKQSISTQIQRGPEQAIAKLQASLGKDLDIPAAWKKVLPEILAKNQQLIDPLVAATKGDPSLFSNTIFGRGVQVTPEDFKILNALNTTLQEKFAGLTNRQFHTDSIPSLMFARGDPANVTNKTDRFYENLDQFQRALHGEQTPLYSDLDDATRARLNRQIAAATQTGRQSGYGELQWFPGNREAGFLTTHAGWIPESLPTQESSAPLKATRTLGLMLGDHSRVGGVPLDLSSLGPLSGAQAKAAMNLIQGATVDVANRRPVSGFNESPLDPSGKPLFSAEQLQRLKDEASRFAVQSHALIDSMHKELIGQGLPPRAGS